MTSRPAIVTVASPTSLLLLPLAEEPGEEQMTHAPTAQKATGNQLTDDLFLVSAAFPSATRTNSFLLAK